MTAPVSTLLDELSIKMWQPPLVDRWRARSVPPPAMTVLLVLAFETDVQMDGLLGFLENSTGEFLPEIAAAFDAIGATDTACLLEEVVAVMAEHGVTHAGLREGVEALPLYAVGSFADRHRESTLLLAKELERLTEQLYLNDPDPEPVHGLLEVYASEHREALLALLAPEA